MPYLSSIDLKLTKCTVKKLSPTVITLTSSWSSVTRSFFITMAVFLAGKFCGKARNIYVEKSSNQPFYTHFLKLVLLDLQKCALQGGP